MIQELLETGKGNATPGKDLAAALDLDIRSVSTRIEKERREGAPICATYRGSNTGYYLAANKTELKEYCKALRHRAGEIKETEAALAATLESLPD